MRNSKKRKRTHGKREGELEGGGRQTNSEIKNKKEEET
jgi:hypothetical protein